MQLYSEKSLLWYITDLVAPTLSPISDRAVACGQPYDPDTLGKPSIQDLQDSNPSLTYKDKNQPSCQLKREWTATDAAGNTASLTQVGFDV